ncbi:hypothetical protein EDB80DRAFT_724739 [Ilyonectria destructans]|nr:hypothetical protein EDB80DRAFT_724739 [Ilyonectria destructans]
MSHWGHFARQTTLLISTFSQVITMGNRVENRRRRTRDSERLISKRQDSKKRKGHATRSTYTNLADAITPIATFAGGFTLATQVIVSCPNTRLQALLSTASQLFLDIPLVLLVVHIVLYGKEDADPIHRARGYRAFIMGQFFVAGVLLITAFLLLTFAIYAADTSRRSATVWGIVLMSLTATITILASFYPVFFRRKAFWKDVGHATEGFGLIVLLGTILPQLTFAGILVGFGCGNLPPNKPLGRTP